MGIEEIVIIAVAVAGLAYSVYSGEEAKSAARRQEELAMQRQAIIAQQRELERRRQEIALGREARARIGSILNNSANHGLGSESARSTTVTGAVNAVNQGVARELQFSEQGRQLALQADALTLTQIQNDTSFQISKLTSGEIGAGLSGIGTIASTAYKAGVFTSSNPYGTKYGGDQTLSGTSSSLLNGY